MKNHQVVFFIYTTGKDTKPITSRTVSFRDYLVANYATGTTQSTPCEVGIQKNKNEHFLA